MSQLRPGTVMYVYMCIYIYTFKNKKALYMLITPIL